MHGAHFHSSPFFWPSEKERRTFNSSLNPIPSFSNIYVYILAGNSYCNFHHPTLIGEQGEIALMSSNERRHHQSTCACQWGLIEKTNEGDSDDESDIVTSSSSESSEVVEELKRLEQAPPFWRNRNRRMLSKQLSMCETPRDVAWEKRRLQILNQERKKNELLTEDMNNLTDEDLSELRGSIELGFGFNEDGVMKKPGGRRLCNTLPALDLYFAVNRQFATSPVTSPSSQRSSISSSSLASSSSSLVSSSSSIGSPNYNSEDSWKICSPGDSPQQVKTKLRHWAQAVACSVRQSH